MITGNGDTMTDKSDKYCPKCRSKKPMMKAGFAMRRNGDKQLWKCRNKQCSYITVNPLKDRLKEE